MSQRCRVEMWRGSPPLTDIRRRLGTRVRSRRFRGSPTRTSALLRITDSSRTSRHVRKVPEIGIGGSLAAPPLPHHRTYGSVYGGSRSYANALRSVTGDRAI